MLDRSPAALFCCSVLRGMVVVVSVRCSPTVANCLSLQLMHVSFGCGGSSDSHPPVTGATRSSCCRRTRISPIRARRLRPSRFLGDPSFKTARRSLQFLFQLHDAGSCDPVSSSRGSFDETLFLEFRDCVSDCFQRLVHGSRYLFSVYFIA